MNIKLTNCTDCPFMSHGTDSWDNDYFECTLKEHLSEEFFDNTIGVFGLEEQKYEIKQPEWCPLLNDKVEVSYENNNK